MKRKTYATTGSDSEEDDKEKHTAKRKRIRFNYRIPSHLDKIILFGYRGLCQS